MLQGFFFVCVCVFFLVGFLCKAVLSLGVFEGEERSQEFLMGAELSVMDALTSSARDCPTQAPMPGRDVGAYFMLDE